MFSTRISRILALVILLGGAFAIRMYDLTDLPFDFHPTRQLLSIIRARGLFYETQPDGYPTWKLEMGVRHMQSKADIEPIVFERLVAYTYRFTGEQFWISRIYSSLFWLIGAVFLFLIVRELVSFNGAVFSLTYFLFFPYTIIASRSFQPDILMIALTLGFWWTFLRWTSLTLNPSPSGRGAGVRAALLSGLLGGFAIFIKFPAVFFVIGGALGLVLSRYTLRDLIRNAQLWIIALLGMLPAAAYVFYGVFLDGRLKTEFGGNFYTALMLDPLNYLYWEVKASIAAGGIFIMLGLLGWFLVKDKTHRSLLTGLWIAYFVFGMYFNYHAGTHDYYHLPLIPIVALSLSPFGELAFARLGEAASSLWMRSVVFLILLFGMFSVMWDVRNQMKAVDYRPQAEMYAEVGNLLDHQPNVIALTEDYGSRLQYFGSIDAAVWPYLGDIKADGLRGIVFDFEKEFEWRTRSSAYFIVTDLKQFDLQPDLKAKLAEYPIFAQGDGYVIYQLMEKQ